MDTRHHKNKPLHHLRFAIEKKSRSVGPRSIFIFFRINNRNALQNYNFCNYPLQLYPCKILKFSIMLPFCPKSNGGIHVDYFEENLTTIKEILESFVKNFLFSLFLFFFFFSLKKKILLVIVTLLDVDKTSKIVSSHKNYTKNTLINFKNLYLIIKYSKFTFITSNLKKN